MALLPGTRLGSYVVTAQIGVGGMGEVYRATDTTLKRDVAIKVLPAALATDPDRLARFQREAEVLASLNHPNIAAIYGLEKSGGVHALVLELVEGPTLADRIAASGPRDAAPDAAPVLRTGVGRIPRTGPSEGPYVGRLSRSRPAGLPVDEALAIARQIADALEAAHEQRIVHRDLKPANVKVRDDGTVKVLDFGLAKALEPAGGSTSMSQSPTITTPAMTQAGVILGTAAYMSPEQAKGRDADKRSDVWAFGAVLFEMLTGRRAFDGEDMSDTLASVLKSDPDWTLLPSDVPPALRTLLQRCLAKDRRQRVSEIAAAKFILSELDNIAASPVPAVAPATDSAAPRRRWQRGLPAGAAAALTAVVVGAGAWALRPGASPPVVARFSFTLPEGQFTGTGRQVVAISPDGTRLAYVADLQIYLRSIGELEPRAIQGTKTVGQGLVNPMFAPDGDSIAFIDLPASALKRVPIAGGRASTIADMAAAPSGATWGPEGILIASEGPRGILRVSPNGGVPELIVGVGADEVAWGPQMLPGGQSVLFTLAKDTGGDGLLGTDWDEAMVVTQSLADGTRRVLIEGGSDARYLPTGHLLYAVAGTMFAVPFDAGALTVTGAAVPVIDGVRRSVGATGATQVAVSQTGTLVYLPGPATTSSPLFSLVLGDNRDDPVLLKVPPAPYVHPRVSPDGGLLAVGRNEGQDSDVWTYDLSAKTELRRLTFGGDNRFPVWSGDGRRVTFQSGRESDRAIFWQPVDGGTAERLTKPADGEEHVPESWSRDGRHLLFSVAKESRYSLWVFTLDGRKTAPFGGPSSGEPFNASFSPDGRWVAYAFTERAGGGISPNRGVFVEPFPATGEKYQLPKTVVDFHPVWATDGRSIAYVPTGPRPTMSVPITTRPAVAFGTPVELTRGPRPGLPSTSLRGYDFLPDDRFVSVSPVFGDGRTAEGEVRVVLNWFEELKRLVPAK